MLHADLGHLDSLLGSSRGYETRNKKQAHSAAHRRWLTWQTATVSVANVVVRFRLDRWMRACRQSMQQKSKTCQVWSSAQLPATHVKERTLAPANHHRPWFKNNRTRSGRGVVWWQPYHLQQYLVDQSATRMSGRGGGGRGELLCCTLTASMLSFEAATDRTSTSCESLTGLLLALLLPHTGRGWYYKQKYGGGGGGNRNRQFEGELTASDNQHASARHVGVAHSLVSSGSSSSCSHFRPSARAVGTRSFNETRRWQDSFLVASVLVAFWLLRRCLCLCRQWCWRSLGWWLQQCRGWWWPGGSSSSSRWW